MTNDQFSDLLSVLKEGLSYISQEIYLTRAELGGVSTAIADLTDELREVKVHVRDLSKHGIDVFPQK